MEEEHGSGFGYAMDERGGKVNSVESVTGIPATDDFSPARLLDTGY